MILVPFKQSLRTIKFLKIEKSDAVQCRIMKTDLENLSLGAIFISDDFEIVSE